MPCFHHSSAPNITYLYAVRYTNPTCMDYSVHASRSQSCALPSMLAVALPPSVPAEFSLVSDGDQDTETYASMLRTLRIGLGV